LKKTLSLLTVILALGLTAGFDAEAKRLGGGKSSGMQRQNIATPAAPAGGQGAAQGATAPAAASTAAAARPGAAAAAAPKRSWMGPIAGLAAGLGLAALASHFGFGEALANMMMIGLLIMAVLVVVGLVLRKRAQGQTPAMAGAGGFGAPRADSPGAMYRSGGDFGQQPQQGGSLIGARLGGGLASSQPQAASIPADFDVAAFERNAKDQFMALQAANDAGDLARLRDYLTPDLFDDVRADLALRGDATQQTEVFGLQAQVLNVVEEDARYVVSVRFTGSVRDQHGAVPEDLDEVWHLTKPRTGFGGWVIAGIQQMEQQ
jgi:predicted lipid-binding transport protein (Tim44 family)